MPPSNPPAPAKQAGALPLSHPRVKNLAKQATDRLAGEISALNGISGEVVNALHTIRDATQAVGTYVTSTTVVIDEQTTVTCNMSASMQCAAAESSSIGGRAIA
jgi:methyl-accepting chemotaxis protein